MKAHVHETGRSAFTFRSLFFAVTLIALALIATLGFSSTSAFAADKENVTDIKVPANETVLVSSKTVPVDQEVTQDDYDKLSGQYNVSPNGPNTITSKTQEVESVETKTDTGKKSRTRTTTTYVISGPAATPTPEDTTNGQENPTSKLNPLVIAPVAAAVTAPAVAIPTALVTAVPATITGVVLNAIPAALTGAALNAIPAALTGAALNAIPALLTGNVLNAIPAALTGAALNAIPAALTGSALKTIPAFTAGVLANAIPAALTGAVLNAIPAVLAAAPFIAVPTVLAAAPLITVPAVLTGAALNILPVALVTAPLAAVPAVLAAIPFIAVPAVLLAAPFIAVPAALIALALPVIAFLAVAVPTVTFATIALPIAGLIGLHILNTPLRLAFFTGLALLGLHILNTPLRLAATALLFGDLLLRLVGSAAAFLNPFDLAINGFAFPVNALIRNFNFLVLAGLTALNLTGLTLAALALGALTLGALALGALTLGTLTLGALALGALTLGALTLGALTLGALGLGADFLLRLAGTLAAVLNPLDLGINGFLFPIIALIRNFNFLVLAGLTALNLTGLTLAALALGALTLGALGLGVLALSALALGADFLLRLAGTLAAVLNPLDFGPIGFLFPIIALIRNFNHIVLHTLLRNLGALNALANPFSFGGPLFRLAKGFIFPITESNKNLLRLFLEIPINFIPVTVGLFHALRDPLSWIFFPIGLIKFAVGYLFPLAALYDDLFVWAYWHSVLPFAILSPVFVGSVLGLPVVMVAIGPLGKIAEIINVSLYYWVLCVPLDSLVFMAEVPFTTLRELIRAQVRILLDIFW